jgi:hypothetical protein
MRDGLRHAAACRAANHLECPKFLQLVRVAGKQQRSDGKKRAAKIPRKNPGGIA